MEKERPKVGVGVIVMKQEKVLLGKRKNAHGEGTWCFPGGHLEMWEELWQCAKREVKEETGLEINIHESDSNFAYATTNDMFHQENRHYVTLFVRANYVNGKPKVMEPEKCERWNWFKWNNLPSPLFIPIKNLIKQRYKPFK